MKTAESKGPGGRVLRLGRLLKAAPDAVLEGSAAAEIVALAYDSRLVSAGSLFFALPGARADGLRYAEDAVRRGALAVVHEGAWRAPRGVASVRVANARKSMGYLAAEFYGRPSEKLRIVGVTGTNGKTTTTFMVRDMLAAAGIPAGLMGTIRYEYGGRRLPAARTTPESPDLQRMFAESANAGDQAVAMEVSSQGLSAERLRGTRFAAAAFTNLTPDHLDFHGTMEAYYAAKRALFESLAARGGGAAAVNLDDAYGRRLAAEPFLAGRVVGYGLGAEAAVRAEEVRCFGAGSRFVAQTPWGRIRVDLPLAGRFNVLNALAALAVCGSMGVGPDAMGEALARLGAVPGRLEKIDDPRGGRHLFVDYAHSEDALRNVLQTLRQAFAGKIACVFGCGGNRDRAKRPRMGAAVSELADEAFVTSDNPRGEDPAAIARDVLEGMASTKPLTVELDRAAAIRAALRSIRAGDVLLVAGKGHETYQETGGRMSHFDDREALRAALAEEGAAERQGSTKVVPS